MKKFVLGLLAVIILASCGGEGFESTSQTNKRKNFEACNTIRDEDLRAHCIETVINPNR